MGILKKCLTIGLCTTVMCLGLNVNGTSSLAKTPVDQMPIAGVTSLLAEMRTIKVSVSSTEATEVGNNETVPVEEVVVQPYTDEDLYLLSHVIAGEANYCDYNMKLYVGSVVLNRVKSPLFPNTLKVPGTAITIWSQPMKQKRLLKSFSQRVLPYPKMLYFKRNSNKAKGFT